VETERKAEEQKREAANLSLSEFRDLAVEHPNHMWTPEQVRTIAGPLFSLTSRWIDAETEERLQVLFLLPVKRIRGDSELTNFLFTAVGWQMDRDNVQCRLDRDNVQCRLDRDGVNPDEVYPAIKDLSDNWLEWTEGEVATVVDSLEGIISFDASKATIPGSTIAYLTFTERWGEFLPFHPEVMKKV